MAYNSEKQCKDCSQFTDHKAPNGRGWCELFDIPTRQTHARTHDCVLNLPKEDCEVAYRQFELGDTVKIIDEGETDHNEWSSFLVIGARFNPACYQSVKSYLTETSWTYWLSSLDRQYKIFVKENEICLANEADLIETSYVF